MAYKPNTTKRKNIWACLDGAYVCRAQPAAVPTRGSALKKLTKHLARCGCKYEVGCCSAVAARLNFVINQTLVVVCHIYSARVAAMCDNEPNKLRFQFWISLLSFIFSSFHYYLF